MRSSIRSLRYLYNSLIGENRPSLSDHSAKSLGPEIQRILLSGEQNRNVSRVAYFYPVPILLSL